MSTCVWGQEQDSIPLSLSSNEMVEAASSTVEQSKFKQWWNSLVHGNVDRTFERKMDMSFIVAPCYTREGSFGIGGAATALYRLDRKDSIMQPSDISLSGSATVKGFYAITVKGNNHFRGNRSRLTYLLQFQNKNLDFWGIDYDACARNSVSAYRKQMINWESDYVYKLTPNLHVGAALNLNYTRALRLLHSEYLEGQNSSYFFTGVGLSLQYDTRDFILNPKRGVYFLFHEVFYPEWLSNYDRTIFSTTLILMLTRKFGAEVSWLLIYMGDIMVTMCHGRCVKNWAVTWDVCEVIMRADTLTITRYRHSWNSGSIFTVVWAV